tara:strand:- start:1505 stop:2047 length:543 start_codon:yes stop_codon:yes gene_type:complete
MVNGKKVYLSSMERENLEQLRQWRNQPELRKYFREYREITKDMQNKWYENRVLNSKEQVDFEIHDKESNKLIGHCGLYYIDWIHRFGEFGIYIGDDDFRSGGYGSDALRTLIGYGFNDLNLNKIWCEVYDNNNALSVYKHVGFVYEGKMRQNYFNEGKYWDSHILSMLKVEYDRKYKGKK